MWQPFGKVCGVSKSRLVSRFSSISPLSFISARLGGELEQRDRAVGADHFEQAAPIGDVLLVGFQHMRRELPALFQHRLDGAHHRAAGRDGRARGDRRPALDFEIAVAVPMLHMRHVDAELVRHEPRIDGGMTLTGRLHAEIDHERVVAGKGRDRRPRSARRRNVRGSRKCRGRAAFRSPSSSRLRLLEAFEIGERQRLVEDFRKLAAVEDRADRGLVGHGGGGNEIALSQRHARRCR